MLNRFRRLLACCAEIKFVREALAADIDLSCMNRRPTAKEQAGIFLILLSYVLGWPAVAGFGFLAMYLKESMVLIIGGPAIYIISHFMFIAGIYIAGKEYARVFLQWSLKKFFQKMQVSPADKAPTA
jgi:hypothetical protein